MISSPDHTRIFLSDRLVSISAIICFQRNISVCFPTYLFIVFILHRANDGDRHVEHMDNVRLYHQSLHEQTAPPPGSIVMGDVHPSSSLLISTLRYHSSRRCYNIVVVFKLLETQICFFNRKKLSELDNIQRYFNQKLSPPTFPSWGEQDFSASKPENQRETDACQLLFKSKQLVGEVNSIITGELFLTISIIVNFDRLAIYSLGLCRSCLSHYLWLKDITVL